jgi:signal peptidase I
LNDVAKQRRPWLAALLSCLAPGVGQLYCKRPRRAVVWLLLAILSVIALYLLRNAAGLAERPYFKLAWGLLSLLIWIAGIVDAWRLAKHVGSISPGWYNRWYVYLPIILIIGIPVSLTPPEQTSESFSMPSASMAPTLVVGDIFAVSTSAYKTSAPQPGDVVVIKKKEGGRSFVKRVVAVGGDRVQMKAGRLYINGAMVEREALGDDNLPGNGTGSDVLELYRETLPNGRSYRIVELSDKEPYDNTPEFLVPPGALFLLGDNRDSSLDSRAPGEFGLISLEHVIGRVVRITASEESGRVGMEIQ